MINHESTASFCHFGEENPKVERQYLLLQLDVIHDVLAHLLDEGEQTHVIGGFEVFSQEHAMNRGILHQCGRGCGQQYHARLGNEGFGVSFVQQGVELCNPGCLLDRIGGFQCQARELHYLRALSRNRLEVGYAAVNRSVVGNEDLSTSIHQLIEDLLIDVSRKESRLSQTTNLLRTHSYRKVMRSCFWTVPSRTRRRRSGVRGSLS